MARLLARVSWEGDPGSALVDAVGGFRAGRLSLHLQGAQDADGKGASFFHCPDTQVLCALMGYISNLSRIAAARLVRGSSDAEIAGKLYSANGASLLHELDGVFLICVFDESAEKAHIFQSDPGFDLNVYYSLDQKSFLLSTSLKKMLRHSTTAREFDFAAARDFLRWHLLVPNKSTLVKHVSKLMPGTHLVVDYRARSAVVNRCRPKGDAHMSRRQARRSLIPSIEQNIERALGQLGGRRIVLTLTGGWDCNLLLYLLREMTDKTIEAVTIDGGGEASEVAAARQVLASYEGVRHMTCEVREDLSHFADLVWRFEGAFFNEGMFVRYELGSLLRGEGVDCVILGSSADQVLWPESLLRKALRRMRIMSHRITGRELPERGLRRKIGQGYGITLDDTMLEFNLKMHGISLNSFGVERIYPFVSAETMQIGRALGLLYNWRKRVYVEELKRVMPPSISQHLKKSGNVVDTARIFAANRNWMMRALKSELVGELLSRHEIDRIAARPEEYHLLIMQLAYLDVFKELFISGGYDSHFEDEELGVPLPELL